MRQASRVLGRFGELRREGGVGALVGKVARVAGEYARSASAARELRRRSARELTLDQALDLAYSFEHRGVRIPPLQHRSEIEALLNQVEAARPERVLEIGIGFGGTLFLLTRVASDGARVAAIDLPPMPRRYHPSRELVFRSFARRRQRVRVFPTDSHDPRTLARVRRFLAGPVDLLLIDGDHSYEGVSRDWELYRPLVRPGGLVAIHDVVPAAAGVSRFWTELKASGEGDFGEIVGRWEQVGGGIGVVRVSG